MSGFYRTAAGLLLRCSGSPMRMRNSCCQQIAVCEPNWDRPSTVECSFTIDNRCPTSGSHIYYPPSDWVLNQLFVPDGTAWQANSDNWWVNFSFVCPPGGLQPGDQMQFALLYGNGIYERVHVIRRTFPFTTPASFAFWFFCGTTGPPEYEYIYLRATVTMG